MELTDKMTFWRRAASKIATDKLTEVKVALTKIKATVSLSKISKNEIGKNEEGGATYIWDRRARKTKRRPRHKQSQ